MDGRQEEIHNILVALLSGDEKEIYNVLYKKKEIDDKTPKLRSEDEKKELKSLSYQMRKFPKNLIDGIQKVYSIGRTWSWPVMSAAAIQSHDVYMSIITAIILYFIN